jgi:hypothetical protein
VLIARDFNRHNQLWDIAIHLDPSPSTALKTDVGLSTSNSDIARCLVGEFFKPSANIVEVECRHEEQALSFNALASGSETGVRNLVGLDSIGIFCILVATTMKSQLPW